jgi:hypothetical protein
LTITDCNGRCASELHHEKQDDPQKFKPDSTDEDIFSAQVRKNDGENDNQS